VPAAPPLESGVPAAPPLESGVPATLHEQLTGLKPPGAGHGSGLHLLPHPMLVKQASIKKLAQSQC
jgi:hypothetical protein